MVFSPYLFHFISFSEHSLVFLSLVTVSFLPDFDQDDYLGKEDLKQTLRAITANELTDEEMEFVSDKVLICLITRDSTKRLSD